MTTMMMMTFVRYRFVINVCIVGTLCVVGLMGNCASVVVLRRDKEMSTSSSDKNTSTTNWLLQMLAAVDIFFLISCLLIYSIKTIHSHSPPIVTHGYAYVEPYLPGMASIGHMLTIYTVLLVTVDRFIAVCRPMSRHLRSIRRARLTFAGIVLLSIGYSLPVFLEQHSVVVTTTDACTKDRWSHVQTVKTRMRKSALYFIIYKTICYVIFRSFGPLIAIIVLNGRLISALRRLNRRHLMRKPVDRDNLTMMIVTVISIFIICQLPDVGLRVILSAEHLLNPPPSSSNSSSTSSTSGRLFQLSSPLIVFYVKVLSHALLTFNSSINFLIYCLIGRKFRRIFIQLFIRRRRRPSLPLLTTVMSELPVVSSSAANALTSIRSKSSSVNLVASKNRTEVTEL